MVLVDGVLGGRARALPDPPIYGGGKTHKNFITILRVMIFFSAPPNLIPGYASAKNYTISRNDRHITP